MGRKAWDGLALEVIDWMKIRIDPRWIGGIELEVSGGEHAMAVRDLAGILADDQAAVTAEERNDLLRLLRDIGEPTDGADRLNVRPRGDGTDD